MAILLGRQSRPRFPGGGVPFLEAEFLSQAPGLFDAKTHVLSAPLHSPGDLPSQASLFFIPTSVWVWGLGWYCVGMSRQLLPYQKGNEE